MFPSNLKERENFNTSLKKGLMASAVLLEKQPIVMFKTVKVWLYR